MAAFPLYWPLQYARTAPHARRAARFLVDFVSARTDLLRELNLLGARDVVLSSNVPIRRDGLPAVPDREPDDPGIAVYFTRRRGSNGDRAPFVIACDQFTRVRWNLRAVGATLEALRSIERHGTTSMLEQAFSGFAQLPAAGAGKPWREVLGVPPGPFSADTVRARLRELAREHHPDVGGSSDRMVEITAAYEAAMRELGGAP
ncbi:MAG: J domain-containing protein [Burkholderiales bacterium]